MSRRSRAIASWAVLALFLLAWAVSFRPQVLGGPARFVGVSGRSMTPTMSDGDLTMVHKRSTYSVGDVVAYRIPEGQPNGGHNIIHRVIGGDGRTGYTLRGDYNDWNDIWHPTDADVLGEVVLRVPGGANLLGQLRQPWVLASVTGLITFVIMLWPRRRQVVPAVGAA